MLLKNRGPSYPALVGKWLGASKVLIQQAEKRRCQPPTDVPTHTCPYKDLSQNRGFIHICVIDYSSCCKLTFRLYVLDPGVPSTTSSLREWVLNHFASAGIQFTVWQLAFVVPNIFDFEVEFLGQKSGPRVNISHYLRCRSLHHKYRPQDEARGGDVIYKIKLCIATLARCT